MGGHTETVHDLRHVGVPYGLDVLAVDHTVVVEILVLDVARTYLAESALVRRRGDVSLVLEQSVGHIAECLPSGLAGTVHVLLDVVRLVLILDDVTGESEVTHRREVHLADLLVVLQGAVPSGVPHPADVDVRLRGDSDIFRNGRPLKEYSRTLFLEPVHLHAEFVEERDIHADIQFA